MAIKWYTKAARAKHVLAQRKIAEMYEKGPCPVARNLFLSAKWYYWAGENGDAEALFKTGVYCELGIMENPHGVEYVKSLYEKAKALGCVAAAERLREMSTETSTSPMCGVQVKEVISQEVTSASTIEDIVAAEEHTEAEILRRAFTNQETAFQLLTRKSVVLRHYVEEFDFCELDIPKIKFSIAFNEKRKAPVIRYADDYYEDRGDYDDRDDYMPRTFEDAYEIYGSRLWDA